MSDSNSKRRCKYYWNQVKLCSSVPEEHKNKKKIVFRWTKKFVFLWKQLPCHNHLSEGKKLSQNWWSLKDYPIRCKPLTSFHPPPTKNLTVPKSLAADTSLTGVTPSSMLQGSVSPLNKVLYEHRLDTRQLSTQDEALIAAWLLTGLVGLLNCPLSLFTANSGDLRWYTQGVHLDVPCSYGRNWGFSDLWSSTLGSTEVRSVEQGANWTFPRSTSQRCVHPKEDRGSGGFGEVETYL